MTRLDTGARSLSLAICVLVLSGSSVWAQRLSQYATDQTGTLTAGELSALNDKLTAFDRTTSTQVVVLMVASIDSGSLEETTYRIAKENGIGRKEKNNGALLFIARNDRKIRIEVGYGLEGVLTDALCGVIIRHEIAPRFRQGEFYQGIDAGVDAIFAATRNEYTAEDSKSRGVGLLPIIVTLMIFFWVASLNRKRRGIGGIYPPMFFPGGGRSFGGWGGGGGGFSGGGGSFGGGGASGSW